MIRFFVLLFFSSCVLVAQGENQILERANKAYQENDFIKAAEQYELLLKDTGPSATVYYNLGNSYYRQGKMGKAVLYYEKASVLAPNDEDITHNLKVVRQSLLDDLETLPEFFLSRWWNGLRQLMTSGAWSGLGLFCFWIGIGGFILWLMGSRRELKKQGFIIGLVFLILSILPFALAFSRASYEKDSGYAVIMDAEITLRSAPDEKSVDIMQLHEGTKVALIDVIGEWYKVKLQNGEQGWLPEGTVEKI